MMNLTFRKGPASPLRILCLGAHADDIEIGCGGTVWRLLEEYPDSCVDWVVLGAGEARRNEALESADQFLRAARDKRVVVACFQDGFFPYSGHQIKEFFEEMKMRLEPDIIFTHYGRDLHQDHSLTSELTWNTFRNHMILEYEIPKYDGDMGSPNLFVHLDETLCRRKVRHILDHFKSQGERDWFTEDTFLALLRLRGMESRAPGRYSEAFYCRKVVI